MPIDTGDFAKKLAEAQKLSDNQEEVEEEKKESNDSAPRAGYEFEPDVSDILNNLLPSYLTTSIYQGLIDSDAAEQGARRKAMKVATDNATDMIASLNLVYNRARQSAITQEITEIVAGSGL